MKVYNEGQVILDVDSVDEFLFEVQIHEEFNMDLVLDPDDFADHVKEIVVQLADRKTAGSIKLLLGVRGTPGQIERYQRKYQQAVDGKFTKKENTAVIAKHNAFLQAVDQLNNSIEMIRMKLFDAIDAGKTQAVYDVLSEIDKIDHTTSKAAIGKILKKIV